MFLKTILVYSIFLFPLIVISSEKISKDQKNSKTQQEVKPIQPIMQDFFNLTTRLNFYLVSEEKFIKSENEKEIQILLKDFKEKTIELKKNKLSQDDSMKFRVLQLADTVTDAESAFKEGFKNYSFWAIKASLNNCYSCHTDKSLPSTTLVSLKSSDTTDYQNAEFLFLVRNYKEAIPLFEKLVKDFPKTGLTSKQLDESLKRLLQYYVRTEQNPQTTLKSIDKLLMNKKLPQENKRQLLTWEKYFKANGSKKLEAIAVSSEVELKKWIEQREALALTYGTGSLRFVVDLETQHQLFKWLEATTDSHMKPWYLYYSADQSQYNRASMFDMTSELYLTECIEAYPSSSAAQQCLDLFKEIKVESFTGSSGTHVPDSTYRQIKKFEELIKKNKKK